MDIRIRPPTSQHWYLRVHERWANANRKHHNWHECHAYKSRQHNPQSASPQNSTGINKWHFCRFRLKSAICANESRTSRKIWFIFPFSIFFFFSHSLAAVSTIWHEIANDPTRSFSKSTNRIPISGYSAVPIVSECVSVFVHNFIASIGQTKMIVCQGRYRNV